LKIKALIELEGFPFQTYLMISRSLDSKITNYILENRDALSSYEKIKKNIDRMQNIFFIVFILVVFVSVFIIRFLVKIISDQLVKPINDFVFLTSEKNIENVNLSLLKEKKTNIIELNILINAFNSIIEKLNNSKREIDEHNNFINAIFSQTPYGLFIFNISDSKIVMENDATNKLLLDNISNLKNLFITKIKTLILEKLNNKDIFEESFELTEVKSGKNHTFLVKIIRANFSYLEKSNTKNENKYFLIIFNDITEHISYQRNLLWIDVAKRITHEIRNPLTPILLSVERLEYKFTDSIEENNRDRFLKYLENIKKHTLTISNIIDEFIEFGKMPEPEFHEKNLNKIILETIEGSYFDRNMKYELNLFEENDFQKMNFIADEKQIMRVLLNIFKNSFESFVEKKISSESLIIKIQTFFDEKENLVLEIEDNGPGFPSNLIEKMTEPYVTTKKKGSGLGLSIVKRIISDHNGSIFFENIFDSNGIVLGARILIKFLKR
jgi:two-component system nitrogen regulation sensor histidine kinase NtrY